MSTIWALHTKHSKDGCAYPVSGCLEEPRSGGIVGKGARCEHTALVRPYFDAPQSDTSFQYPLFGAPHLTER